MPNNCSCQKPPGGDFECPPNSMPLCRLENGQCKGKCYVPDDGLEGTTLLNWALAIITDKPRRSGQVLSFADNEIIRTGRYVTEDPVSKKRVIITFNISFLEGLRDVGTYATADV